MHDLPSAFPGSSVNWEALRDVKSFAVDVASEDADVVAKEVNNLRQPASSEKYPD